MAQFIAKRYPEMDEIGLAKRLLVLAENKSYQKLMTTKVCPNCDVGDPTSVIQKCECD